MITHSNYAPWLTARRLRAQGALVAVCIWLIYAWNISTPSLVDRNGHLKGTDFLHFYTLGSLALAHRGADLYDIDAQSAIAVQRVPGTAGIRYLPLYPPQVSIFFAPLARLPYGWALELWWAWNAILYGVCCYAIWRACPNLRHYGGTALILAVSFPPLFHLIAWGQTSALVLACYTLIFFLLRGRREFAAGIVLGCLVFKPQLAMAAAVVFLCLRAWRVVAGAVISTAVELCIGVVFYGLEPLRQWARVLTSVGSVWPWLEPRLYQTYSLRTFWSILLPWPGVASGLYIVSAVIVLALTVTCWKRGKHAPLALPYSVLLFASVLVAPHLTVYDLVILAPAFLLLSDWLVGAVSDSSSRTLALLLYLSYLLPLAGPLARWTHLQLSVIAMAATLYAVCMIIHQLSFEAALKAASAVNSR